MTFLQGRSGHSPKTNELLSFFHTEEDVGFGQCLGLSRRGSGYGFSFSELQKRQKTLTGISHKLSISPLIITTTIDTKQFRGETNLTFMPFKVLSKLLNVDLDITMIDKVLSVSLQEPEVFNRVLKGSDTFFKRQASLIQPAVRRFQFFGVCYLQQSLISIF